MDLVRQSLKQRTTYRDYTLKWLADERGEIAEPFRERFRELESTIAAKMQPGDELWEYEYGNGNAFAAVSGLAIVRDGKVIDSWVEWKS